MDKQTDATLSIYLEIHATALIPAGPDQGHVLPMAPYHSHEGEYVQEIYLNPSLLSYFSYSLSVFVCVCVCVCVCAF